MKNKLVLWGTNGSDERILIALELKPDDNKVNVWTFPDAVATEEFSQQLFTEWRDNKEIAFPDGSHMAERELTVTESLLPDDIKVERGDLINRAQTEWHFVVLSSKLAKVYATELEELSNKVKDLKEYSKDSWEELKEFWGKVQQQVQERNLLREHADEIRDRTNELFTTMKAMRDKANEQFRKVSKENLQNMYEALAKVEQDLQDNFRFQPIFEELKNLQRQFKKVKLTREDRNKVWDRLDAAFKKVKEIRFGEESAEGTSSASRSERRKSGLDDAIQKMKKSIERDQRDLQHENERIARTDGQLEAQIRQAKIMMIEERIRSKEEKLKDMVKTRDSLEKKIEQERKREEKRKEEERIKQAEQAAKEKIAQQIEQKKEDLKEIEDKLEKAADALTETRKPDSGKTQKDKAPEKEAEEFTESGEKEEGLMHAIGATLGESIGEAIDTAKAVAKVVGEKLEHAAAEAKEEIEEVIEDAKEALEETGEEIREAVEELGEEAGELIEKLKGGAEEEEGGDSEKAPEEKEK